MAYDRDEWRRPWRAGDLERTTPVAVPAPGFAGSSEEPAGSGIARYPQPPPTGWGEATAGPGSPAGSVRPPDTVGTVDAPAARRRRPVGVLLGALIGAVLGTLGTLAVTGTLPGVGEVTAEAPTDAPTPDRVAAPTIEPLSEASIVPAVAEAVTPSVVRIDVRSGDNGVGPGGRSGLGSGVIYRSDGFIITNHHVIEGATSVEVRLADGDVLEAEIIGSDELNDIAVVKVDAEGLPAINLRPVEEEPLLVGETVIAIGSPFGLDASVTAGVLSALNREIRLDEQSPGEGVQTIPSILQTDAAINPGNSGGALVDAQGRLVGINTAILSRSGASQGVGFAVGVEQAMSSASQLIDQGFVRHPLLGIAGTDVSAEVAEEFGLPAPRGAIIESVQPDSGASSVDLRPGDVIVSVDGERLATMSELVAEVRRRAPGDEVLLEIFRDGETFEVAVELGERPR
ncbi:MAG: trypsin-like peptidase domain-containing protein [Nitriliruptoraceae bacterium]